MIIMRQIVKIDSPVIQLNQLLKWIGLLETGGQTNILLDDRQILLNGVLVHEKRKKIYPGDTVTISGDDFFIVQDESMNDEC